jgi:hypothetical protein
LKSSERLSKIDDSFRLFFTVSFPVCFRPDDNLTYRLRTVTAKGQTVRA